MLLDTMLAVGVVASFLLIGFGVYGVVKIGVKNLKPWLMITVGILTLYNVYNISTMPDAGQLDRPAALEAQE